MPFYEEAGAIRDVIQNHMLQVVAMLAMEPPGSNSPDGIRDEKVKVLRAIRPLEPDDVVRGQYLGYRQEKGVAPDSRGRDVRRGPALDRLVAMGRRAVPDPRRQVPGQDGDGGPGPVPCPAAAIRRGPLRSTMRIIIFAFASIPRRSSRSGPWCGRRAMGDELAAGRAHRQPPTGRRGARLRPAAAIGDGRRSEPLRPRDGVEAQWRIVEPVLGDVTPIFFYEPGSWGPAEADRLLPDGDEWHNP